MCNAVAFTESFAVMLNRDNKYDVLQKSLILIAKKFGFELMEDIVFY